MPTEGFSLGQAWGPAASFIPVFARTAAAMSFLPLPFLRQAPAPVRAYLAGVLAVLVFSGRSSAGTHAPSAAGIAAEAVLGAAIGAAVGWLTEILVIAAQVAAAQAGFSFAAMIDPTTQADSSVLQLFAQLTAGLLFVALDADRGVIRLLSMSFDVCPAGTWTMPPDASRIVISWTAEAFSLAVRLALPTVAVLGAVDLVLGLAGRLNPSLQLLSLVFPAKALGGIVLAAWICGAQTTLLAGAVRRAFETVCALIGEARG